jgi:transposase
MAEKKLSGIKIHIAVDTNGLPHSMWVTTANVSDRDGAVEMLKNNSSNLSSVIKILTDGGYTGENFSNAVKSILGEDVEVEIVLRSEMHKFVVIPKRWVVERSFAWLEKCRRLWKNCERKLHTTLQMASLAFLTLILRRY